MTILDNVRKFFTVNSNPCVNVTNKIHHYYYEVKTILEINITCYLAKGLSCTERESRPKAQPEVRL